MSQSVRQEARKRAQQELLRRKEEAVAREARITQHVIEATTAHIEQQRAIADTEERLRRSIHELMATEKVSASEVASLTGLPQRDINRLRRDHQESGPAPANSPAV